MTDLLTIFYTALSILQVPRDQLTFLQGSPRLLSDLERELAAGLIRIFELIEPYRFTKPCVFCHSEEHLPDCLFSRIDSPTFEFLQECEIIRIAKEVGYGQLSPATLKFVKELLRRIK
jgi:hypothetical protein